MEGISHEACSFAGTLGLGKLIVFYDDNGISIDGKVVGWFTDDTPKRFEAYGWHVVPDVDGHERAMRSRAAVKAARARDRAPVAHLLQDHHRLRGAPQAGHRRGARRGARAPRRSPRRARRWAGTYPPFVMPDEIRAAWDHRAKGAGGGSRLAAAVRALRARTSRNWRASSSGACAASCPRTGTQLADQALQAALKQTAAQATRAVLAGGAERHRAGAAGAARRLGRPDRLEQHAVQGRA